jgi:hypothetical protein
MLNGRSTMQCRAVRAADHLTAVLSRIDRLARGGVTSAFYRDDWLESAGLHADQFDASDVTQLFEKCRAAIAALGDLKTMHVGRAIWRTGVIQAA